jgi:hypothetical protein
MKLLDRYIKDDNNGNYRSVDEYQFYIITIYLIVVLYGNHQMVTIATPWQIYVD